MAEPIPETRRVNPVIFVVIAAVVLLAAVWFFFLRDTGGGTAATTRPRAQAGSTTTRAGAPSAPGGAAGATTTTTKPGGQVQETFQIFEVKNPFLPLVSEGAGGGGAAAAPGTGTTGGTTAGTTGGTTTGPAAGTETPSTGPGTGTGAAGAAEPQPSGGTRVSMLEAPFTQGGRLVANVKVGSTVYTVGEGDTFATSFKVVSLDASCGVFLFGDSRFTLCAGQEVLK